MQKYFFMFTLILASTGLLGFKANEAMVLLQAGAFPFDIYRLIADGGLLAALIIAVWWFVKDRKDLTNRLYASFGETINAKDAEIEQLKTEVNRLREEISRMHIEMRQLIQKLNN